MFLCYVALSDYTVEERPSETLLIQELENGRPKPLVFVLNANLLAMVKMVNCRSYCLYIHFTCAVTCTIFRYMQNKLCDFRKGKKKKVK